MLGLVRQNSVISVAGAWPTRSSAPFDNGAERTRAMRSQKEWVDTHGATNAIRSMDDGSTDGKLRSERSI